MVEENINLEQTNQNRPKLRKIKRPKNRVVTDIPTPPEKSNFDNIDDLISAGESVEQTQQIENNLILSEENRGISNSNTDENSYVLDGMPPELDYVTDDYIDDFSMNSNYVKKSVVGVFSALFLFVGIFVGKTLFSSQRIEAHGLEGVVINQDVPSGRPRCGLTAKDQACVFYFMNWYKQELNGRDFYKIVADLTGREEYMIESDNLRYANVKIKPGHFAQLNIPALK